MQLRAIARVAAVSIVLAAACSGPARAPTTTSAADDGVERRQRSATDSATGARSDDLSFRAPRPGTYRYRVTGADPRTTTLEVVRVSDSVMRERYEWQRNQLIDIRVVWRDDRKLLTAAAFSGAEARGECRVKPGVIEYSFPLRSGQQWSTAGSCTLRLPDRSDAFAFARTASVTGSERIRVGEEVVETFVVRSNNEMSHASRGRTRFRETVWFAPALGLPVKRTRVDVRRTPEGGEATTSETWTLLDINPD